MAHLDQTVHPTEDLNFFTDPDKVRISKEDEKAYARFCELRVSSRSAGLVGIIFSILATYMYLMSLSDPKSWYILGPIVVFALLIRNPVALLLIVYRRNLSSKNPSRFFLSLKPWFNFLMNMVAVSSTITLGLFLIARVLNGKCDCLDQMHMWGCNSEFDSHALPQEMVLSLMLLPFVFATTLRSVTFKTISACWAISVISMVVAICVAKATVSIPIVIAYIPLSMITLYELNRQNVILFLTLKKQQFLMDLNKKLSLESQNELRFMIANMAHDLKTVSVVLSMFID